MLVLTRPDVFRLVRQHDHGLVAGALAGAWRAPPRPRGLPWTTVMAASLHDVVWRPEDELPRLDGATGRPHDFVSLPAAVRRRMLDEGLGLLARLEPAVAALVREHHEALRDDRTAAGEAAWIRFADFLSLRICLTLPGGDASSLPPWAASPPTAPGGGPSLTVDWVDPTVVRVEPFPFGGDELHLEIPFRDVPRRRYEDERALRGAWSSAPADAVTVRVTG